ncbi:hypothetical protein CLV24_12318 [Pontibacter ummariensis]|uniref:Late embryogenesis abundant protein n=1 Tax=Pontibacter ummariensis TaxID=1610492 RepID=A0A239JQG3_9BACT|nr:hypothetical protein [Pontibacter ummariensis]PRY07369.1 hypothetical protein CLV24_12318 [Pontibacter ummariensis]SNT07782.1 hypothetical protein SAMN06296052_12318 [Pontibacter ummariensis]
MIKKLGNGVLLLALLVFSFACKTKEDIDVFKEAEYSLKSIDKVEINGVDLLKKKSPQDFSFSDAALLFSAFSENKLSATSTLNLQVDLGEGNEDRTMTVSQLKWQLLLADQQTLSGVVAEPVELKDGLNTITVSSPLKFAEENGKPDLNKLLRLATLLQQDEAKRPKVTLQIKPTILTSVGPFELPSYINIKE